MHADTKLKDLLLRWEELRRQGQEVAVGELCRDCPELQAELHWHIEALQFMDSLLETKAEENRPPAQADPAPALPLSLATEARYAVVRWHAQGGLGEVLVAQDERLHRQVALKRMRTPHVHDPQSRGRFLAEAATTSRLEHPGIVPVYGLGQDSDGRPFYAMRYIQGETLQEAIRKFHDAEKPGRDPGAHRLALRQLLGRFVTVCNTIAYAHSRGMLHRDLKPSNIMLGQYGETLVLDWGLVKPFQLEDAGRTGGAATPVPGSAGEGTGTQTGAALGTPAFMSPEQAAGQKQQVGPASDIYNLGATLYALLTGEAPFQGNYVAEVVEKAQRGLFPPPRHWKPDLPRALEAICLKAMARQPRDRYGTALELAADLEHWLADEPVSAWPEPWAVRARRWLDRHRTLMTAVAAAVGVALVSLAMATLLLAAANDREQKARRQAEAQEERAKENFVLARQAVDEMLTEVGYQHLKDVPQAEAVRRALLTRAQTFYQKFLREGGDDPVVHQETARTYRKLGDIHRKLDQYPEAEDAFRSAVDLQTSQAEAFPAEPGYRHDLAETQQRLGFLYRNRGQMQRARDVYQEALVARERLVAEHPRPEYRDELAYVLIDLGVVYYQTGAVERAREAYERARDLAAALQAEDPVTPVYQERGARARNNLGILHAIAGRVVPAEEMFRENLRIWEKLRKAHPEIRDYRDEEAKGWNNLGSILLETGRTADATAAKEKARDLMQDLARDYPLIPEYRSYLASSLTDLGQMHQRARRWDRPSSPLKRPGASWKSSPTTTPSSYIPR